MNVVVKLKRINENFNKLLLAIAGTTLVISMLLIVGNGIIRIFSQPFGALVEVVGWCAAIMITFSIGSTQIKKEHASIDFFFNKLPKTLRKVIEIINIILAISFFIIVIYQLVMYAINQQESNILSMTLSIPFYPVIFCTALGFLGLVTTLIIDLLEILLDKGEVEWHQ